MGLSDRIILFRAKHRITQQQLAEKCGVSKQTILAIENGTQVPSKITRAKIELVIGREV